MNGSVGNVTFSTAKGQTTARMKVARKSSKSFTIRQARRIVRWANIIRFWQLFCGTLKPSFESCETRKSMFNKFVGINANVAPVYLTKFQSAQGGCVVAPYVVSLGTLPEIAHTQENQIVSTDITLGVTFSISASTTVKQFSDVVINANDIYQNGDQITFYWMVQSVDASTGLPRVRIYHERLKLDTADATTMLRAVVSDKGFSVVDGKLGMGSAVVGGAVYVHTRDVGNKTLVSTQRVVVTHDQLSAYSTEERMLACARTYGSLKDNEYLTPEVDDQQDVDPGF